MDTKLIAALACAAALVLGACSGGNPPAGPAGADPNGGTPDADPNGGTPDDDNGDDDNGDSGPTAASLERQAKSAIDRADAAAAAGNSGDRPGARNAIENARKAIKDAVDAADAEYEAIRASASATPTARLAAYDRLTRLQALQETQRRRLDDALDSLAWYGRALARYELANGEAVTPREGTNTATIKRIPRTIDTSATNSAQKRNPDAFCRKSFEPTTCKEDTFKTVMYEDGKKVFSVVDDGEGGDEFKVDGWVGWPETDWRLEAFIDTGLKLTNAGLVIRTGGTISIDGWPSQIYIVDYADMRRDMTRFANDVGTGQNGWDLEITFDAPQTPMPVPDAPEGKNWGASWQGNGDFYWRSIVPAARSQLDTDGEYYKANAFGDRPDGYKKLGIYEVWLSNHVGVDTKLEPVAGRVGTCPDDSIGTSCPYDDEQFYLDYAAYGLFVLTADTENFLGSNYNGRASRVNTLHFGYSAFADEDDKRTTDIGEAITGGKFQGQTLAYEVQGGRTSTINTKLLRGDVVLTVNIPKGTGAGTLQGTMRNFQRWNEEGGYWTAYADRLAVTVNSTAISADGTFSGRVAATPSNEWSSNGQGLLKGSFYGPRNDSNDLEIAGSYTVGQSFAPSNPDQTNFPHLGAQARKGVFGSFAAKQRPDAIPPSN